MRRSQMNLIARNAVLVFFLKKSVQLPIRYDFKVIRLKGSPHQEVCEQSITTSPPPPPPHTHTHTPPSAYEQTRGSKGPVALT